MLLEEIKSIKSEKKDLRNFGITFGVLLGVLAGWFQQDESEPCRQYVVVERASRTLTYRLALFPLKFRQEAGWLLTIEDLTERVNMRQQMARMDRLASLGRMSAGIAHEVRNPLTGVILLLDELHDRMLSNPGDQQLIRRALEEIERLESLVNELLRFASMQEPKFVRGKIDSVLLDSLFLTRKQCQRGKISIDEQFSDDLPELMMDTDRLKQVFLNLFNNAIDAMPDGGTLSLVASGAENYVDVWIKDSGVGIGSEQLPLIFEPFYTSKGQGTGLGLAISYNIISDHNGSIDVQSQPGEGTSFHIRLPLEQIT